MLKNYLAIAIRILLKQKTYSLINILGLSIGLASTMLISIYILDELSYDKYITDAHRIYRAGITEKFQGEEISYTDTPAPLAEAMRKEIPEVESSVRIAHWHNITIRYKDKVFTETKFYLADSNFFKFFGYRLIEGNAKECLRGPGKVVITESTARKYFDYKGPGDNFPIGKFLEMGHLKKPTEVTGIVADGPHNSHFKFDMIYSTDSWDFAVKDDCWACYGLHTYFKLNEGASLPAVEKVLDQYVDQRIMPKIGVSLAELKAKGDRVSFFIHPLTSIHLESHNNGEFEPNGDIRYIYIFGAIAIFIILIACINFMNLATARASGRAKEVGIRKTIGAFKGWLVQQFMVESFLYVLISTFLALILVVVVIHPFNLLSGKELNLDFFKDISVLTGIVAFVWVVGLLSGSYPAFYLTSFKPIEVLKGKTAGSRRSMPRSGLVVFQFAISMGLIISTLVIYKQLKLIQEKNIGFDRENIIKITQTAVLRENATAFKNELVKHSEFINASYADQLPPAISNTFFVKSSDSDENYAAFNVVVDYDHLQTMGYKMKDGRFFSKDFPSDSSAVILNETCARLMGYEKFEGRYVTFGGKRRWDVIGIIKDFNFEGLRNEIKPLVMFGNTSGQMMSLRITADDTRAKLKLAESIWNTFETGLPFQYSFIDEDINAVFHSEQQMGKIFWVFTVMAIFIACLGLFGLITYTAAQRTKEIGIRKVMGATVAQITVLISGNLLRLVTISFVIAIPITWYSMNQWLESFAYRTNIDFVIVLVSCAREY